MTNDFTEDRLVQKTTAEFLKEELFWNIEYAHNTEVFGKEGSFGRESEKEVILTRYLLKALKKLNPGFSSQIYEEVIEKIQSINVAKSLVQLNKEKYVLFKDGVSVKIQQSDGSFKDERLKIFDFQTPSENHFLAIRELWIKGKYHKRRPDIIGFVNGIPLLFVELKNYHRDIKVAYDDNFTDYKDTIPEIFIFNSIVMLSNGSEGKIGSITSRYEHFHEWKRLDEKDKGSVEFETMLRGICLKENFIDIFENFTVFDDRSGKTVKIIARNHQYLGVNKAIESIKNRNNKKGKEKDQLGVFWHTQGSGKSYSMVFFCQKAHRRLLGNYTFLVVTDRKELDRQIYKTFASTNTGATQGDRASDSNNLADMLKEDKRYVFTLIHKFSQEVNPGHEYSLRDDIIVLCDEAHRTQYGRLAMNMRNALPNAAFIAFTGTPLFTEDELTRQIFGDYVSMYPFDRAVKDGATVPLYYENRGGKLEVSTSSLNSRIAEVLEAQEIDSSQEVQLEKELKTDYLVITLENRLDKIAKDFVDHYCNRWETGKAMIVCLDKLTCLKMWNLIEKHWRNYVERYENLVNNSADDQEEIDLARKLNWLKETERLVVVSDEQNEVKKFQEHGLDIIPHRDKIRNGLVDPDGKRVDIETAFKDPDNPFRVAIVCSMWLTGFDVESLSTLYIDKPMKGHSLMQTIARANRVYEGKDNGLIVEYNGMTKSLREALATYAQGPIGSIGANPPLEPEGKLIDRLKDAIELIESYILSLGFDCKTLYNSKGFKRIKALNDAVEAIVTNDETKRNFELFAVDVFKKFLSAKHNKDTYRFASRHNAIKAIYLKLQPPKEEVYISNIVIELQKVLNAFIEPASSSSEAGNSQNNIYDISNINFDQLQKEFTKVEYKNTIVQNLKGQVHKKVKRMISKNPKRIDFEKRFQEIVSAYNQDKERKSIEDTFLQLTDFLKALSQEENRASSEGLNEERLSIYDILLKPELSEDQIEVIRQLSRELIEGLKAGNMLCKRWREKEVTKADVKTYILDFLYEQLPEAYSDKEVNEYSDEVFMHVFEQYEDLHQHPYL
ncbi:type I restriction endonuclease subunit R [Priestia aryabhattai]|uniref:type I restriction endonuclease subunit R n=1 Tax=Priestia aryabhattai TaxID=412384 RepID=UPI0023AFAD4C|nr:type I restriction endonuclease subunit R [Priestia aryabhattai]MDE8674462.1 type I restriction endonuclease subunit R [Priestia aryabhattai]